MEAAWTCETVFYHNTIASQPKRTQLESSPLCKPQISQYVTYFKQKLICANVKWRLLAEPGIKKCHKETATMIITVSNKACNKKKCFRRDKSVNKVDVKYYK
jgi:hypothetical protein